MSVSNSLNTWNVSCYTLSNSSWDISLSCVNTYTGSTAWYNDYSSFVPKSERLMLDMVFIIALFWFFFGMIKFVFKVLFK